MVQSQRIETKKEEPMHRIRKQSGEKESDGKLLLSLSIQSYAGHRHQTKGTIFSEERSRRDKSGVKPGFSPNRITSKGQVGPRASLKRSSRNMFYC